MVLPRAPKQPGRIGAPGCGFEALSYPDGTKFTVAPLALRAAPPGERFALGAALRAHRSAMMAD
jgi:hypothetical protein